MMVRAVSILS